MAAERLALRRALGVGLVLAWGGCTTFAGLSLEEGTGGAPSTTSSSAGGGDGGARPLNDPDAYLPLLDAAELCALVGECPRLGASIVASLGVPIVAVDVAASRVTLSYSACLDWMASPVAPGRVGFEAQRELLYGIVPSGCDDGLELLPVRSIAPDDARCDAGTAPRCDGDDLVDCGRGVVHACSAPPFGPATRCIETSSTTARCGITSACDGGAPACDGSFGVTCADDVLTTFDCATVGLGCSAATPGACGGESGAATCTFAELGDEGCSADGERATVCLGGWVGESDCDALGLRCVAEGRTTRCGDEDAERSGARCSPNDPDVDVCDGDVLRTCVAGARVDVDCGVIGRRCAPPFAAGDVDLSARCARGGN